MAAAVAGKGGERRGRVYVYKRRGVLIGIISEKQKGPDAREGFCIIISVFLDSQKHRQPESREYKQKEKLG